QLEVLESLWPVVICLMVKETRQLADLLGLDHDLSVLENVITKECSKCCTPAERELFGALANKRREALRNESIAIGEKFYAETPKQFCKRFEIYWKSWQSESNVSAA